MTLGKFKALALSAFVCAAHAQGTIRFETYVPEAGLDAPVWVGAPPPVGVGVGPAFSAALYYVSSGFVHLVPGSTTTFQDGSFDAKLAHYVVPRVVEIPGTTPGGSAVVRMAAWLTSAGPFPESLPNDGVIFDGGRMGIFSPPLTVSNLGTGAGDAATLPPSFQGMTPVPEPSALSLLAVSGFLWFLCRNQRHSRRTRHEALSPPPSWP